MTTYTGTLSIDLSGANSCYQGTPSPVIETNFATSNITWGTNPPVPAGTPDTITDLINASAGSDLYQLSFGVSYTLIGTQNNPGSDSNAYTNLVDLIITDNSGNGQFYPVTITANSNNTDYNFTNQKLTYCKGANPYVPSSTITGFNTQTCQKSVTVYNNDVSVYGYCNNGFVNQNQWPSNVYPETVIVIMYTQCTNSNNCNGGGCHCEKFDSGLIFSLNLTIYMTLNCTGPNLEMNVCNQFCALPANYQTCYTQMNNYCFAPQPNGVYPISVDQGACQTFYPSYINYYGPDSTIDNNMGNYCQGLYQNFDQLINSSASQLNLCACNLNESLYTNYLSSINDYYPGFAQSSMTGQCLFTPCANSNFKTTVTGKQCNVPTCLNIVEFNQNGTFDNSNVKINQNNKGCSNFKNTPDGPKFDISQIKWWVWVIVAIVVIVLIGLVLFLIFGVKTHKSDKGTVKSTTSEVKVTTPSR